MNPPGIYTRVSTDQQTHDSQLNELRDYCRCWGWTEVIFQSPRTGCLRLSRTLV